MAKKATTTEDTAPNKSWAWTRGGGRSITSRDQLLDAALYSRQVISILLGIVAGVVPLVGWIAFVLYAIVSSILVQIYVVSFLGVYHQKFASRVVSGNQSTIIMRCAFCVAPVALH